MPTFKVYINRSSESSREIRYGYVDLAPVNGKRRYTSNNEYGHTRVRVSPPSAVPGAYFTYPGDPRLIYALTSLDNNRLYARIVDAVTGTKGELLTSALEWKSSLDMITKRAITLRKAYLALRRFDLPAVGSILSLSQTTRKRVEGRIRKIKTRPKPTELWLEYWMGWAPLMGDIGLAIDVLQVKDVRPDPGFRVGVTVHDNVRQELIYGQTRNYVTTTTMGKIAAYGKMRVTNHNLLIADQLGFTNPALTAWQMVPFSFIVDWFTNVGQVLGSLNDFAGVELYETGTAKIITTSVAIAGVRKYSDYVGDHIVNFTDYFSQSGTLEQKQRAPGPLPMPTLTLRFDRPSLTRAATSISLLSEVFLFKNK